MHFFFRRWKICLGMSVERPLLHGKTWTALVQLHLTEFLI